jgi:integrase
VPRKGNGVRKDPRTGKFVARFVNAYGKRVSCVRATQKEALAWLAEQRQIREAAELAVARGELPPVVEPPREVVLVGDFAERWLDWKRTEDDLSHATILDYGHTVTMIKEGPLGAIPAHELKVAHVEAWLKQLTNETKGKGAAKKPRYGRHALQRLLVLLRAMTRRMKVELELPTWACETVKLSRVASKRRGKKRSVFQPEELRAFLAAFAHERFAGTNWPGLFWVLATTGMRPCEALALHRHHIDLERGSIRIEWSAYRGVLRHDTKTGEPREPALHPETRTVLQTYLDRTEGDPQALMFPNGEGTPHCGSTLRKPFRHALRLAGIEIRPGLVPYSLRDTFNSRAKSSGADDLTLRSIMGHADKEMTGRYLTTPLEKRREIAHRVLSPLPLVAI